MEGLMKVAAGSALLVAALASSGVMAADLPIQPIAPAVAPITSVPLFTWSGGYLGVSVGYGWGIDDRVGIGTPPVRALFGNIGTFSPNGWLGGLQAGYNLQLGQFVVGAEGDFQWTGIDDRLPTRVSSGAVAVTGFASTDLDWYATLRARAGITFDRFLVYGTAGVALAMVDYRTTVTVPAPTEVMRNNDAKWGYVLGGGVEYAFNENLSMKGEYQYIDISIDPLRSATYVTVPTPGYHTVRVGLNYRFSGL
ncbi:outer membrane protein [Faunimonas sp. B44]|uniref:outer membrane protein n=1 Tax=Faunimonas sp. B44 TaxID=3461493 RepID=UPI0040442F26